MTRPHPVTAGWYLHGALLLAYPLVIGLLGYRAVDAAGAGPMLPSEPAALLLTAGFELLVFGVVFSAACLASRCSAEQLMLRWHGGLQPLWLGMGYSLVLRLAVVMVLLLAALLALLITGDAAPVTDALQPRTGAVVDAQALSDKPLYLGLNLTVISFVVAGLREELWRAGLLAACLVLFPAAAAQRAGRAAFVVGTALVFGLGHLVQGLGGVLLTTLLGIGLGAIMLHHRSIWPAVLAHGFFNATSFLLLWQLT